MTDAIQVKVFFGKNKFTVSGLLCHSHRVEVSLVSLFSTALARMVNFHSEDLDSKHWFISPWDFPSFQLLVATTFCSTKYLFEIPIFITVYHLENF